MKLSDLLQLLYPFVNFNSTSKYEYVSNLMNSLMREPITTEEEQDDDDDVYYPFSSRLDKTEKDSITRIFNGRRQMTKEEARRVVSRYDDSKFKAHFDSLDDSARNKLVEACFNGNIYVISKNLENVFSDLFHIALKNVCEGMKEFDIPAKYRVSEEKIIYLNDDKEYKHKYGPELIREVDMTCPCKGCNNSFVSMVDGESAWDYKIIKIDPNDKENVKNLIAVCSECAKKYTISQNQVKINELKLIKSSAIKKVLELNLDVQEAELVGIKEIIEAMRHISFDRTSNLRYDPVVISDKIHENNGDLYAEIKGFTEYYGNTVKQLFMEAQARYGFKYDRLCQRIRWTYEDLRDRGDLDQEEIYDQLVEGLVKLTNGKRRHCCIIIAFFVQNCEVFDVITK